MMELLLLLARGSIGDLLAAFGRPGPLFLIDELDVVVVVKEELDVDEAIVSYLATLGPFTTLGCFLDV